MLYVALAGPLAALGILLAMQALERWLVRSVWRDRRIQPRRASAAYEAFDTDDMLKSVTRQAGIAVRVK